MWKGSQVSDPNQQMDALAMRQRQIELEIEATRIKEPERDQRRKLLAALVNRKVHDIVTFADATGSEQLVVKLFVKLVAGQKDVAEGDKVIAEVQSWASSSSLRFRPLTTLVLVTFKDGSYWLDNGQKLIKSLQDNTFNWR